MDLYTDYINNLGLFQIQTYTDLYRLPTLCIGLMVRCTFYRDFMGIIIFKETQVPLKYILNNV